MPARLSNINVSRPQGMKDSSSLRVSRHATELHELSVCAEVCTVNTFGLEAGQWLAGSCGGCGPVSGAGRLFIHKPGGNCKMKRQTSSSPDTFNDHTVQLLHPGAAGRRVLSAHLANLN